MKIKVKEDNLHETGIASSLPMSERDPEDEDHGSCEISRLPVNYDDQLPESMDEKQVRCERNASNGSSTGQGGRDSTQDSGKVTEGTSLGNSILQLAFDSTELQEEGDPSEQNDRVPQGSRFSNTALLIQSARKSVLHSGAFIAELGQQLHRASVVDPSLLGPNQCSAIVVNYISAGYILLPFGKSNALLNPGSQLSRHFACSLYTLSASLVEPTVCMFPIRSFLLASCAQ